jgi:flagellar hook assembly protein FlgD
MEDEGSSLWGITSYSSEAYDGERCAMLSTSTGQTIAHTIHLRLKYYDNTKKYTLHGWIKTSRVSSANVVIRFYNTRPSGGAISTVNLTDSFSGTNGWTWFYKEISIPSMAYYFNIQLTMTGSSGQASQALFDNVGLIEWTPWQEFAMMNSIPHPNNYYWIQLRTPELVKSLSMRLIETEYQKNHTILNRNTNTSSPTLNSYPNPFNPITTLSYQIMKQGRTSIRVYNLKGQMIKELFNNYLDPGKFTTVWDGTDFKASNVSRGMYVVRLDNSGSVAVRKVHLAEIESSRRSKFVLLLLWGLILVSYLNLCR